MHSDKGTLSCV